MIRDVPGLRKLLYSHRHWIDQLLKKTNEHIKMSELQVHIDCDISTKFDKVEILEE